jgi:HPt (histidine-containing phosphotransfer) domain-containing protein
MTFKSDVTTLKPPAPASSGGADFVAQWSEARNAYPLYAALATQFNFGALPHPAGELPPQRPTREAFDNVLQWLDGIDQRVRAFQIRQLPPETLNASEQNLRAFLQRQLRKQEKTTADRDKIDLLLVQYFALCAPEELYRKEIHLEDVAEVLQPVLTAADATRLEWCEPLNKILDKVAHCESLRDMMELGLLEQGRLVKESAGAMFYDPAALVAFCRFNFLLRRAFIRMLHADLSAVRQAAETLDASGVKTVDCRRAGFSAAETTTQLRYYCENWKQPFHKDYTETSVTHAFEQLLALRADLEEALAHVQSGAPSQAASAEQRQPDKRSTVDQSSKPAEPAAPTAATVQVSPAIAPAPKQSKASPAQSSDQSTASSAAASADKAQRPAADAPVPPAGALDKEKCLESIWEQLIAEPPSRGRSMSTIVLQNTKVLLSSWEVAAFVAEGDQEAEDLRRAVVARALLAVAMEERKRSGDLSQLAAALTLAKSEVSYFQGRVEQAKRAKNTEAAVNLGISTKRLLSFIEEAEKLQP